MPWFVFMGLWEVPVNIFPMEKSDEDNRFPLPYNANSIVPNSVKKIIVNTPKFFDATYLLEILYLFCEFNNFYDAFLCAFIFDLFKVPNEATFELNFQDNPSRI